MRNVATGGFIFDNLAQSLPNSKALKVLQKAHNISTGKFVTDKVANANFHGHQRHHTVEHDY
ncbi:MAG: hypothetical protein HYR91_06205 [Flavobacteriia bacterium]|nr:hypothetical protein [Flavobacteriia bacterium]